MRVVVVCQNPADDRVIPRMARYLARHLGWDVVAGLGASARAGRAVSRRAQPARSAKFDMGRYDALYLSAYFEWQRCAEVLKGRNRPKLAAYFTHREEEPPGNAKAVLFDAVARAVDLRVATCRLYADVLRPNGPTLQAAAPVDKELFTLSASGRSRRGRPVVGLSGYTYMNHRKGEDMVRAVLASPVGKRVDWVASGRGWPVPTTRYPWARMAEFYHGLDVLVVPSRVEGIPMPPLEALACGVPVVIPRGVGLLDELPSVTGIYRYERGNAAGLAEALEAAAFPDERAEPEALRAAVAPYSVEAWCNDLARAFAAL